MSDKTRTLKWLWQLPLACFILAGLTGFLYRLGMVGFHLWDLNLANIRHAHSHLMFFSWAVPLPMYFIIQKVNRALDVNGPNILMTRMAYFSLFLGLASFPFFLLWGYRPVPVAGMGMPLSVILSGLVMLCWYGFMAGYWKERKFMGPDISLTFFDGSLIMLFISSLGAWGVAFIQFMGIESPLFGMALTHFFLATFTEGWVVLVLLGILYEFIDTSANSIPLNSGLLVGLILFGAPLTFPYGISDGLLSTPLLLTARAGGLLACAGLALNLFTMMKYNQSRLGWTLSIILSLLALKAGVQFLGSVLPSGLWLSEHGLRIFYLHLLLLGGFSLTLFFALSIIRNMVKGVSFVYCSVLLLLASLLLLTPLWPQSWIEMWHYQLAALVALLPPLAVIYFWYRSLKKNNVND